MRVFVTLVGIILFTTQLNAQESPSYYREKYKDYNVVKLLDYSTTEIAVKDRELHIQRHVEVNSLFLNKLSSAAGRKSLEYHPPFTEITDVKAATLAPHLTNDKYQRFKVKSITDKKVMSEDVFHDGTRAKVFTYPSLQEGAITELEYIERIVEPRLFGRELFHSFIHVEDISRSLVCDDAVELDISYVNCTVDDFHYTRENKRGKTFYTWRPKSKEKLKEEPGMPHPFYFMPQIVFRIKSYTSKDGTFSVLRGLDDLYDWHYSLLDTVLSDSCHDLDNLVDTLVYNMENPAEKTAMIYKWVQNNIKYIAFEEGEEGFIPRTPSKVFVRRYGDCKDMSSLMVKMLIRAGVTAYHTWIGTRDIPYRYADVPSPMSTNHMICTVILDTDTLFFDPTGAHLPFGLPSEFIQGKEALVGIGPDEYFIKEVPVVDAAINVNTDSVYVQILSGDLVGNGVRTFEGFFAGNMNKSLDINDKKTIDRHLRNSVQKGNNKCISNNHEIALDKRRTNLSYDLSISDYAFVNGSNFIVNMNLEKILHDASLESNRLHPIHLDHTLSLRRDFVLEIPDDMEVSYVPEGASFEHEKFEYHIRYHQLNDALHYQLHLVIRDIILKPEDFEEYNKFIEELNRQYNETVILNQI